MGTDRAQNLTAKAKGGNTLAIPMLHCTKHDAVYSDGLIAIGPFLVALSIKGIPQSKIRFEQISDCNVCVIKSTCTGHVRHTVPKDLLVVLA